MDGREGKASAQAIDLPQAGPDMRRTGDSKNLQDAVFSEQGWTARSAIGSRRRNDGVVA
jgi:hypothetical protein